MPDIKITITYYRLIFVSKNITETKNKYLKNALIIRILINKFKIKWNSKTNNYKLRNEKENHCKIEYGISKIGATELLHDIGFNFRSMFILSHLPISKSAHIHNITSSQKRFLRNVDVSKKNYSILWNCLLIFIIGWLSWFWSILYI